MLRTCPAYDDVDIEKIFDLEQQASQRYLEVSIRDQIREHTEAIYNGFIENWERSPYTCPFSSTEYTCSSQYRPKIFERNGVCICLAYARNMLTLSQVTFMGCSLNSNTEPWHFCKPLPKLSNRVDLEYLKALVAQGYQGKKGVCTYIGHSTTTRKMCGMYNLNICPAHT